MKLKRVEYVDMDSRQKEAYNYQKLSGLLADFGITTIRLSADWEGADFIAQNAKTLEFIAVQLKGRFSLAKKYRGKGLWIAFRDSQTWYLYDHDAVWDSLESSGHGLFATKSWESDGGHYNYPTLSKELRLLLEPYRIDAASIPG